MTASLGRGAINDKSAECSVTAYKKTEGKKLL